jgi:hypothetical protein
MGFFSWLTADTKESIPNRYSNRGSRTVYLLQPDGRHIRSRYYDGYGIFGGIDVFRWILWRNKPEASTKDLEEDRRLGIELLYSGEPLKYPLKFSFDKNAVYEDLPPSEFCPRQGFFYDEVLEEQLPESTPSVLDEYFEDQDDDLYEEQELLKDEEIFEESYKEELKEE